jgi:hypothetical protein
MGKAIGVAFVLAGVGVAASLLPFGSDAEQQGGNGPVTKISLATAEPPATARATAPVQPSSSPAVATVITVPRSDLASRPAVAPSNALPHPNDRAAIISELQKELKRVGCYEGEINATWTPMTRKAMKDFTDRVNATLPVERPDTILLALVLGHQDKACARPCPAGEGPSQDGSRCVPKAILAQAAKKAATPTPIAPGSPGTVVTRVRPTTVAGWSATAAAAEPLTAKTPLVDGRMALAGPEIESRAPPVASLTARPARETHRKRSSRRHAVRHLPVVKVRERRPPRYAGSTYRPSSFVRSILARNSLF